MPNPAVERAFVEPILARSADDGPRLIFADFLEESDDPADVARGELIRLQCALARLTEDDTRRRDLIAREAELVQQFNQQWGAAVAGLAVGWELRRGLLDAVSVDAATFLASGDELFRRAPIRRVRLLDAARQIEPLAACPFLTSIQELDLCGNDLGNGGVNLLLRSPYLATVESLDLSFNGIGDGGLRVLARSPALPLVRELSLNDNGQIGSDGVVALAESPHYGGLRLLDLSGNAIDEVGVRALAASRVLTRLSTLRLFANAIGDAGVVALVGSDLFARLIRRDSTLDLRQNGIGPISVACLVASDAIGAVTGLDLSENCLGDDGLIALSLSDRLLQLGKLAIRQNSIGDRGAIALARSSLMNQLVSLDISGNQLTQKGIDALWAARSDWRTVLDVSDNLATPDTMHEPLQPLTPAIGAVLQLAPAPRPAASE